MRNYCLKKTLRLRSNQADHKCQPSTHVHGKHTWTHMCTHIYHMYTNIKNSCVYYITYIRKHRTITIYLGKHSVHILRLGRDILTGNNLVFLELRDSDHTDIPLWFFSMYVGTKLCWKGCNYFRNFSIYSVYMDLLLSLDDE